MCLSRGGPILSHIFFADDLFLFEEASESQAEVMAEVLRRFCAHSSQKINVGKSKLFISKNVGSVLAQTIGEKWGVPLTLDLGKYLGLPVLHDHVTKRTYSGVVTKVRKKLSGRKQKVLSKIATSLLIHTVTNAVPIYSMQTSRSSIATVEEIEKLNHDSF